MQAARTPAPVSDRRCALHVPFHSWQVSALAAGEVWGAVSPHAGCLVVVRRRLGR